MRSRDPERGPGRGRGGGRVWSLASATVGLEVAVVHRPRYRDWSLPKGKLDAGETWEQAALREVEEETGTAVRARRGARAIALSRPQGPAQAGPLVGDATARRRASSPGTRSTSCAGCRRPKRWSCSTTSTTATWCGHSSATERSYTRPREPRQPRAPCRRSGRSMGAAPAQWVPYPDHIDPSKVAESPVRGAPPMPGAGRRRRPAPLSAPARPQAGRPRLPIDGCAPRHQAGPNTSHVRDETGRRAGAPFHFSRQGRRCTRFPLPARR